MKLIAIETYKYHEPRTDYKTILNVTKILSKYK